MKNVTYILLLFSLSLFGQRTNNFNDSTNFARSVRFAVPPYIIQDAGSGKVLTSDANGRATWQTFTSTGVTQGALDDSISSVRSIRKVDSIYKKSTNRDLTYFKINGVEYSVSDSIANLTGYALQASLNDTASVLRGLIPNVSSYATINNLKDSTALVRGLITNPTFSLSKSANRDSIVTVFNGTRTAVKDSSIVTPTFTLSKNTTRDSIVTVYNGVRSAVKDSSITTPTFSFGRNATLDSIYAIYNGVRYAAKDSVPTTSATSTTTFTNKRITARVDSTTSSATPTINTDNVDTYMLTAQAVNITSFTTNLSGTPTNDQILHIIIKGTPARTISWGSSFEASTVALPTTTVGTNRLDVYFVWNTFTSKWRCGGVW